MKTEVKEFKVLCHVNEEGEAVYHKVIVTNKGTIKLAGHPDLKAEFYYHLMQIQQESLKSRSSWRGVIYDVPTCLHFYFSLLTKKFAKYVDRVGFTSILENSKYENNIDIRLKIKAADNERLFLYLEKFKESFLNKRKGNLSVYTDFTEEAFLKENKARMTRRIERFVVKSVAQLPRFENYNIDPYVRINNTFTGTPFKFESNLANRTYSGKFRRKGRISITLYLPITWYTKIYKKGFAVIPTAKYDNLVVLDIQQLDINKFLVDAITKVNNNTQNYKVQKFVVSRGVTGIWDATRKNSKKEKLVATTTEKEEESVAF